MANIVEVQDIVAIEGFLYEVIYVKINTIVVDTDDMGEMQVHPDEFTVVCKKESRLDLDA